MLESAITATIFFLVFAYAITKRLGLLDAVPRDPKARVASYTASVLSLLKRELTNAHLESCGPHRVAFINGSITGAIWSEAGIVHCQRSDVESSLPLGDLGSLAFELQGHQLSVAVSAAESEGAEHSVQLSLPVKA